MAERIRYKPNDFLIAAYQRVSPAIVGGLICLGFVIGVGLFLIALDFIHSHRPFLIHFPHERHRAGGRYFVEKLYGIMLLIS